MVTRTYTFDVKLKFSDGGALSAGVIGSILDLQQGASAVGAGQPGAVFMGTLVFAITTITTGGASPEGYTFLLQGSNSATFTSGVECLGAAIVGSGAAGVQGAGADVNSDAGVYKFPMHVESNGRRYRYVRLVLVTAGTSPAISTGALFLGLTKTG